MSALPPRPLLVCHVLPLSMLCNAFTLPTEHLPKADPTKRIHRYFHTLLTTHFAPLHAIPPALLLLRQNLFPGNTLPPAAAPPPSPELVLQTKRSCAETLLSLLPDVVSKQMFGADVKERGTAVREVEGELEIWGDKYCNKHLLYAIVELVVVRVLPELQVKGPSELVRERLGAGAEEGVGGSGEEQKEGNV